MGRFRGGGIPHDRPGAPGSGMEVEGWDSRPLILGGPIESELLSDILFAYDFEEVSRRPAQRANLYVLMSNSTHKDWLSLTSDTIPNAQNRIISPIIA